MRRRRFRAIATALAATLAIGSGVQATADQLVEGGPVHQDPGFLNGALAGECVAENPYEAVFAETDWNDGNPDARYTELGCKRLEFSLGPITVKPGQNEALIVPTTIESPRYDGYIVRFKPDLQVAVNGEKTQTDVMHLHHATWLNLGNAYGDGPFFAAGEEKSIATMPMGYGMKVKATDQWGLLYMVHNATTQVENVFITYEIDYIPVDQAEADPDGEGPIKQNILPIKPVWFDVQKGRIHPDAPSTGANPVFHAQRGFGTPDHETEGLTCRWPDQNCARFDMYGGVTPQMGLDVEHEVEDIALAAGALSTPVGEGSITGNSWKVPADLAGTIILLGGHLHPGGIRNELDIVRGGTLSGNVISGGDRKNILVSDALYWDFDQDGADPDEGRIGADVQSWNMSMTLAGLATDWAVEIQAGDILSINTIYDTSEASWYEGMGIIVSAVAPELQPYDVGRSIDVFDPGVTTHRGLPTNVITPDGPFYTGNDFRPDELYGTCEANYNADAGPVVHCVRGQATHGPVPESSFEGGCPEGGCQPLPDKPGPIVSDITSQAFTYGAADLGVVGQTGIPRLVKGETARFWSYDTAARIWHTFTRCAEPCTGTTGVAYPYANVDPGEDPGEMDFDSGELGYGILTEPSKSQIGGSKDYDQQWLEDGLVWEFEPTQTGTFTFWCRIHPGMRGAFEVIESTEATDDIFDLRVGSGV